MPILVKKGDHHHLKVLEVEKTEKIIGAFLEEKGFNIETNTWKVQLGPITQGGDEVVVIELDTSSGGVKVRLKPCRNGSCVICWVRPPKGGDISLEELFIRLADNEETKDLNTNQEGEVSMSNNGRSEVAQKPTHSEDNSMRGVIDELIADENKMVELLNDFFPERHSKVSKYIIGSGIENELRGSVPKQEVKSFVDIFLTRSKKGKYIKGVKGKENSFRLGSEGIRLLFPTPKPLVEVDKTPKPLEVRETAEVSEKEEVETTEVSVTTTQVAQSPELTLDCEIEVLKGKIEVLIDEIGPLEQRLEELNAETEGYEARLKKCEIARESLR